jgi:hypothetical protein
MLYFVKIIQVGDDIIQRLRTDGFVDGHASSMSDLNGKRRVTLTDIVKGHFITSGVKQNQLYTEIQ